MSILGAIAGAVASDWIGDKVGGWISDNIPSLGNLGSTIGDTLRGVGKNLVGGELDRRNARLSRSDEWNFYRSQGVTIPEIMGAGGVGTGPQTASTVLGNQEAQLTAQARAQMYDQGQRDKDRAIALRQQDVGLQQSQIAANASVASSSIAAGASRYGADTAAATAAARLAFERGQYRESILPQRLNDIATSTPAWKRQELLARMGVDNALATLILGSKGLDVMDPSSLSKLSQDDFEELVREIYGYQSHIFGETSGSSVIINQGLGAAGRGLSGWLTPNVLGKPTSPGNLNDVDNFLR